MVHSSILTNGQHHLPVISVSLCYPRWQPRHGWDASPYHSVSSVLGLQLFSKQKNCQHWKCHIWSVAGSYDWAACTNKRSSKRPKMNLKEANRSSNQQENTSQSTEKIDEVKMGCSGKSIGCKPAALSPRPCTWLQPQSWNASFPLFQRQLLTPTNLCPQNLPIYPISSLKYPTLCRHMKTCFQWASSSHSLLPSLPRTTSFYTQIISRISFFCLHPCPWYTWQSQNNLPLACLTSL